MIRSALSAAVDAAADDLDIANAERLELDSDNRQQRARLAPIVGFGIRQSCLSPVIRLLQLHQAGLRR